MDEYLSKLDISAREFARRCGRSPKLIVEILSGKAPIEPETALQFENVLGLDASIWLNIETAYRLYRAKEEEEQHLSQHVGWARRFPLDELYQMKALRRASHGADVVRQLLQFFEAGSVHACKKRFEELAEVSYRHSPSFESVEEDLLVWLRLGELRAHSIICKDYDRAGFMEVLHETRSLTTESYETYLPKIEKLCAEVGVAFVIQPKIGKIALSGISRWLSPRKGLIQQTLRHKKNDHFWFTFFHEAAHLLLHSRKSVFIDGDQASGNEEDEQEANEWSENFLVPKKAMEQFVFEGCFTEDDVTTFAEEQEIAPGVVVGQLQKRGVIGFNKLNHLKETIELPE